MTTTRYLTGTYSSGYTLSPSFDVLSITSTGVVRGTTPTAYGAVGGLGVVAGDTAVINNGLVDGGEGAVGARSAGDTEAGSGGAGGVGLDLSAGGGVINTNEIYGGFGGAGGIAFAGGTGGGGGDAVDAGASVSLVNNYYIIAGGGGAGGEGTHGGFGAAGGAGLNLAAGGTVSNYKLIAGGRGGGGGAGLGGAGSAGGVGGSGGAGVTMAGVGTVTNSASITGGAAGLGGSYGGVQASSGNGGDGIVLTKGGTVSNSDRISGGSAAGGYLGVGGAGVVLGGAGEVINVGIIVGAYGGYDGEGGAGVVFAGRGTLLNSGGAIQGGEATGTEREAGTGVVLEAGGSIDNTGNIEAVSFKMNGNLYASTANGIELFDGGDVTNGPTGYISGYRGILNDNGAATVTNYGTIIGFSGYSLYLHSTGDRLICEAGSDMFIPANGGNVATVELAPGTGTITGLGGEVLVSVAETANFVHFAAYVVDAGGSWTLTGANDLASGRTLTSEATLALAAGATLTIEDGAEFAVQGAIVNAGTIRLAGSGTVADLRVLAGGATLSGGGVVIMSDSKSVVLGISAAATLTNVNNTIAGQGFLGDSAMKLVNDAAGLIEALGSLTVDTKGERLTNDGLMEAAGGGTLAVDATTVSQGGTILAAAGSRVDLEDDDVIGGTVGSSGTGIVTVNVAGGELDGAASAVTLTGVVEVLNGTDLILDGKIVNEAKLNAYPAGTKADLIVGPDGATLSGGGQVGLINANNRVFGQNATDTLTNVNNRIDGAGQLGDGKLTLINEAAGVIVGNTGSALTINTGAATIANAGVIENVGTGGTVVVSALANTGTLVAAGGTLKLEGAVSGAGIAKIDGGTLDAASTFDQNVDFTGTTGVFELARSYTGAVSGFSKTGGELLDLANITFTSGVTKATYSGTATSGVLTVRNATQTATIKLTGDYLGSTFTTSGDGHGGTSIVDPSGAAVHRFVAAAAAMGVGAAVSASPDVPLVHAPMLARPRTAAA